MRTLAACALLLALACSGGVSRAGSSADDARSSIESLAGQWIAAFEAGDLDTLMSLYEPDAYVALHGQPALRGIEAIRDYMSRSAGRGEIEFLIDIERIEVQGDTAYLISAYWFTVLLPDAAEPVRDAGRSVLIFRRGEDERWRIAVDIDQATPEVTFPAP